MSAFPVHIIVGLVIQHWPVYSRDHLEQLLPSAGSEDILKMWILITQWKCCNVRFHRTSARITNFSEIVLVWSFRSHDYCRNRPSLTIEPAPGFGVSYQNGVNAQHLIANSSNDLKNVTRSFSITLEKSLFGASSPDCFNRFDTCVSDLAIYRKISSEDKTATVIFLTISFPDCVETEIFRQLSISPRRKIRARKIESFAVTVSGGWERDPPRHTFGQKIRSALIRPVHTAGTIVFPKPRHVLLRGADSAPVAGFSLSAERDVTMRNDDDARAHAKPLSRVWSVSLRARLPFVA